MFVAGLAADGELLAQIRDRGPLRIARCRVIDCSFRFHSSLPAEPVEILGTLHRTTLTLATLHPHERLPLPKKTNREPAPPG